MKNIASILVLVLYIVFMTNSQVPEPQPISQQPGPQTQPNQPGPESQQPEPNQPEPQPEIQQLEPEPEPNQLEPQPENQQPEPEPEPEPNQPEPQSESQQPEPEPEPNQPEPQPENQQPEPEPNQPEPQSESQQPEPEPNQPEPQPENQQPEPEPNQPGPQTQPKQPSPQTQPNQPEPQTQPSSLAMRDRIHNNEALIRTHINNQFKQYISIDSPLLVTLTADVITVYCDITIISNNVTAQTLMDCCAVLKKEIEPLSRKFNDQCLLPETTYVPGKIVTMNIQSLPEGSTQQPDQGAAVELVSSLLVFSLPILFALFI